MGKKRRENNKEKGREGSLFFSSGLKGTGEGVSPPAKDAVSSYLWEMERRIAEFWDKSWLGKNSSLEEVDKTIASLRDSLLSWPSELLEACGGDVALARILSPLLFLLLDFGDRVAEETFTIKNPPYKRPLIQDYPHEWEELLQEEFGTLKWSIQEHFAAPTKKEICLLLGESFFEGIRASLFSPCVFEYDLVLFSPDKGRELGSLAGNFTLFDNVNIMEKFRHLEKAWQKEEGALMNAEGLLLLPDNLLLRPFSRLKMKDEKHRSEHEVPIKNLIKDVFYDPPWGDKKGQAQILSRSSIANIWAHFIRKNLTDRNKVFSFLPVHNLYRDLRQMVSILNPSLARIARENGWCEGSSSTLFLGLTMSHLLASVEQTRGKKKATRRALLKEILLQTGDIRDKEAKKRVTDSLLTFWHLFYLPGNLRQEYIDTVKRRRYPGNFRNKWTSTYLDPYFSYYSEFLSEMDEDDYNQTEEQTEVLMQSFWLQEAAMGGREILSPRHRLTPKEQQSPQELLKGGLAWWKAVYSGEQEFRRFLRVQSHIVQEFLHFTPQSAAWVKEVWESLSPHEKERVHKIKKEQEDWELVKKLRNLCLAHHKYPNFSVGDLIELSELKKLDEL